MRLHIGGKARHPGWTNLDIEARPDVDIVSTCQRMPMIESNSAECVYASHVLEHLNYETELPGALAEIFRVLRPGGSFWLSVPDLAILSWMFTMPQFGAPERYALMNVIFGKGEHRTGLWHDYAEALLADAGFQDIRRVEKLNLFSDSSELKLFGVAISLNMSASKPSGRA